MKGSRDLRPERQVALRAGHYMPRMHLNRIIPQNMLERSINVISCFIVNDIPYFISSMIRTCYIQMCLVKDDWKPFQYIRWRWSGHLKRCGKNKTLFYWSAYWLPCPFLTIKINCVFNELISLSQEDHCSFDGSRLSAADYFRSKLTDMEVYSF